MVGCFTYIVNVEIWIVYDMNDICGIVFLSLAGIFLLDQPM